MSHLEGLLLNNFKAPPAVAVANHVRAQISSTLANSLGNQGRLSFKRMMMTAIDALQIQGRRSSGIGISL